MFCKHPTIRCHNLCKLSYILGFIDAIEPLKELELERRLVQKITTFIMELGSGFSFIGNQHTLTCNDKEYRVDLLFFHRRLRSMVAIELKIGEFKPEYVGKMNFYLSLLDRLERLSGLRRHPGAQSAHPPVRRLRTHRRRMARLKTGVGYIRSLTFQ